MFNFRKLSARRREPRGSPFGAALLALERGDAAEAYGRLTELLAGERLSAPEEALLRNKRGVALVRMNRKNEAMAEFSTALKLQPGFAATLVNVGNLSLEDGDVRAAITYYEAAVQSDDSYAIAHLNLGVAYKKAGRYDEAVRELRTATRLENREPRRR
ncbi:MAG: tetratricopeptide repeat protein [Candidatus Eremiobacteraeota bacterium]|nr:tetratricopeptide repeat protein [Candidatus Eremiobacteraeota bacterium]